MFARVLLIASCLACAWTRSTFNLNQNQPSPVLVGDSTESDGPLFLTDYILNGQFDEAKRLSKVGPLNGDNVPSYSGYLTVNKTTRSHLFFWFFPALKNAENAPTILWLQGGPGASSMFGLFVEHGPYEITEEGTTRFRNSTWAQQFNMLYIDSPVYTGYSFMEDYEGLAKTLDRVVVDLFEGLQQFFTLFSEHAKHDFYITGQSYAGKYCPALAHKIHENREKAKMKLAGIAVGNGFTDPESTLNLADSLLNLGLIGRKQAEYMHKEQNDMLRFIKEGSHQTAAAIFGPLTAGPDSYVTKVTGMDYRYNVLQHKRPAELSYFKEFIVTEQTRKALHVGDVDYRNGRMVNILLSTGLMESVKPQLVELMNNNYKVLIYTGQLDITITPALALSFVESIKWDGAEELAEADRFIWTDPQTKGPAGYVRQARRFTEVVVRNAGHSVPYDQPEIAYDMIDRFINDKPFH